MSDSGNRATWQNRDQGAVRHRDTLIDEPATPGDQTDASIGYKNHAHPVSAANHQLNARLGKMATRITNPPRINHVVD
ncbi:hypothetical protein C7S18_04575 [Ahniella affigens]|uniref:Uncharacterized protein n=1 Tax=Ahniella affigens TaxID=2021234 RepID=A0A2P1PNW5_9GAMM|nr:hypothetical protein [Ahniella affigens]AVP96516.1 hypothetical protein C7S18_04575 [Ahniella affigens]